MSEHQDWLNRAAHISRSKGRETFLLLFSPTPTEGYNVWETQHSLHVPTTAPQSTAMWHQCDTKGTAELTFGHEMWHGTEFAQETLKWKHLEWDF